MAENTSRGRCRRMPAAMDDARLGQQQVDQPEAMKVEGRLVGDPRSCSPTRRSTARYSRDNSRAASALRPVASAMAGVFGRLSQNGNSPPAAIAGWRETI